VASVERLNRVRVETSQTVVEIPRRSHQELLERLRTERWPKIVERFEAAGADIPVRLDTVEKEFLLRVLTGWLADADRLPPGLFALRRALLADRHLS
jgi:hypothetical protein